MDRTFKKVNEGIDEFDYIYDKLLDSDNQSQKEKLEGDLKKEIKKLQRQREQIKNWMSGNEVKDSRPLGEYRKKIEHEMERFKEVEKAMKTKAFSNEALLSGKPVLDPKRKEKAKCCEFLQKNIEELQRQAEVIEAEVDRLSAAMKKHRPSATKQQELDEQDGRLEKHRYHIRMLEGVMRRLMNDKLDVSQVNSIRDDIEYYVESNDDPEFVEDDDFYEELGDEDMTEVLDGDSSTADVSHVSSSHSASPQPALLSATRTHTTNASTSGNAQPQAPPQTQTQNQTQPQAQAQPPTQSVPVAQPATAGAAATPRVQHKVKQRIPSGIKLTSVSSSKPHSVAATHNLASQLSHAHHSSPVASAAILSGGLKPAAPVKAPKLKYSEVAAAAVANSTPTARTVHSSGHSTPLHTASAHLSTTRISSSHQAQPHSQSPAPVSASLSSLTPTKPVQKSSSPVSMAAALDNAVVKDLASSIKKSVSFLDLSNYTNLPDGFDKYVKDLETAKQRLVEFKDFSGNNAPTQTTVSGSPALNHIYEMKLPEFKTIYPQLESSLLNCPDSYDADTPNDYVPTNQFVTQLFFPRDPAVEVTGSRKLLKKLDLDTLAYCFYYNNLKYKSSFTDIHNSHESRDSRYLQYIAARELHDRSWQYDRQSKTWYHNDQLSPEASKDSAKGGAAASSWNFFDFKDTWMVKNKPGFKFNENHEERSFL